MLDLADELIAFLRSPTFYRSGEWMTTNIAKKLNIPIQQTRHRTRTASNHHLDFEELLPETWKVESRGTRIEVHPAGHYNGGWDAFDVNAVTDVLREMGLRVEKISMETGIS
jgi:hypothetical protein